MPCNFITQLAAIKRSFQLQCGVFSLSLGYRLCAFAVNAIENIMFEHDRVRKKMIRIGERRKNGARGEFIASHRTHHSANLFVANILRFVAMRVFAVFFFPRAPLSQFSSLMSKHQNKTAILPFSCFAMHFEQFLLTSHAVNISVVLWRWKRRR